MTQSQGNSPDHGVGETVLVIPCYNEALRLDGDTYRAYAEATPGVRFLFVNDGSTDNTAEVLGKLKQSTSSIDVLVLNENRGKAEAVRAGMLKAAEANPGFVGYWDADLSTPLEELDRFRAVFVEHQNIEIVIGARVNLLGRSIKRKLSRHYIGRLFATVVAATLHIPIYDSQCGAKLFRFSDELTEVLQEPFLTRWIFDVEILARFIQKRHGTDKPPVTEIVYEMPLQRWADVDGSKLRARDFAAGSVDILRIYRRYLRFRR